MKRYLAVGVAAVSLVGFMATGLLAADGRGGGPGGGGGGGGGRAFGGGGDRAVGGGQAFGGGDRAFGGGGGNPGAFAPGFSGQRGTTNFGFRGGDSGRSWSGGQAWSGGGIRHGDSGRSWSSHYPYYSRGHYYPWRGYNYYSPYYSSYYYSPYYGGYYSSPSYGGYGAPYSYGGDYGAPASSFSGPADSGQYSTGYWAEGAAPATGAGPATGAAGPVEIVNPASNQVTLSFTVNGQRFTLSPGQKQDFPPAPGQVIEFHRGGNLPTARYTLQSGIYTFTPTDQGWELYRTQPANPNQPGGPGQFPDQSQPFQNPPVPQQQQ